MRDIIQNRFTYCLQHNQKLIVTKDTTTGSARKKVMQHSNQNSTETFELLASIFPLNHAKPNLFKFEL